MEIKDLGTQPIRPDAPAGDDAKSDPAYEALQAEIAKMAAVSAAGGGINWPDVVKLSSAILAEKSKDITAACYLMMALLQTKKIDGLAQGLGFFKDFLPAFWEDMFPPKKRMRGRKNAIEWFFTQAETFLQGFQSPAIPEEKMKALLADFDAIEEFLSANMEEPPSGRAVRELLDMIPLDVKEAPGDAARPAAAAAAPPPAAALVGEIAAPADAQRAMQEGIKLLGRAAGYWLEHEPENAQAYIFNRLQAWSAVEALPPAEDRATRIPAPPEQIKAILDDLRNKGDWENLLKAAEPKVTEYLFWLDLSRYAFEALAGMGNKFKAAKEAVARETRAFASRLPGIEGYSFADQVPFADPATREWLAELAAQAGGGEAKPGAADEAAAEAAAGLEQAKDLLKDKKPAEAAALLLEGVSRAGSGRARILWRMALVRLLSSAGRSGPAVAQVELVLSDVDRYQLLEFDPALALAGLKAAFSVFAGLKEDADRARAGEILARIAGLDPAEAIRLDMK